MELGLKNKVVAVTGAGGGIGYAVALGFLKEGCKVAICDIVKENLEKSEKKFKDLGYEVYTGVVDVTDESQIENFISGVVKTYGSLDVWCNNAGIIVKKALIDLEGDDWSKVINTNLNAYVSGIKYAARAMKNQKTGGVILNTASINHLMPTVYKASYAAAKCGVVSLTASAAAELAPYNIRCNSISPAFTATPMMEERIANDKNNVLVSTFPLRRMAKPEDVANMFVFLASDAASFIDGIDVPVSGGQLTCQDPATAWGEGWTGLV